MEMSFIIRTIIVRSRLKFIKKPEYSNCDKTSNPSSEPLVPGFLVKTLITIGVCLLLKKMVTSVVAKDDSYPAQ